MPRTSRCAHDTHLLPLVVGRQGFEWVDEGRPGKPKRVRAVHITRCLPASRHIKLVAGVQISMHAMCQYPFESLGCPPPRGILVASCHVASEHRSKPLSLLVHVVHGHMKSV